MIKETVTYIDFNGLERTGDYYFNFNEAEIMEMEMGIDGGLAEAIQNIIKAQDAPAIVKIFKDIVLKAYGEKTPDGKRFMKSAEISTAFEQSPAYPIIFMKLARDADAAAKFINGIMPASKPVETI